MPPDSGATYSSMFGSWTSSWTKSLLLALTALAVGATVLAAQPYGPPEPIGQGGAPVQTPNYSASQRGSPFYVAPPASAAYGRRYPYGRVGRTPKPPPKR